MFEFVRRMVSGRAVVCGSWSVVVDAEALAQSFEETINQCAVGMVFEVVFPTVWFESCWLATNKVEAVCCKFG